jgi:RND family efflux transporter MFP subunit
MTEPRPPSAPRPRRKWLVAAAIALIVAGAVGWRLAGNGGEAKGARKAAGPVVVVSALAETRDMPVRLTANGTVTALQSVDVRSQVTSIVKEVHIREGQSVRRGELLFTLESGTEAANLKKAEAQVEKDQSDFATAQRNLERQRELFRQKFISQAALDTVQNQVDTLTGQIAIDRAAVEATRVALGYTQIRAPFAGRTGIINVRPGSLVQPGSNSSSASSPALLTITQVDPITVAFTLPEKELPGLQRALAAGPVSAVAAPPAGGSFTGKIVFVDNAVDTATGTIRVKAEFANPQSHLWPGMFVNVQVSPRTIDKATVVPTQSVQTGPEGRFVYVVGADGKVQQRSVKLAYVDEGLSVVEGVAPGARVVVEGVQNLRPGSAVAEADRSGPGTSDAAAKTEGRKRKAAAAKPA